MAPGHESLTDIGPLLRNSFKDHMIRLSAVWNATLCVKPYISEGAFFNFLIFLQFENKQRAMEFYFFEEIFLQKKELVAWFSIWNTSKKKQPKFRFIISFKKVVQQHYNLFHLINVSNNNPPACRSLRLQVTVLLPVRDKILR